MVISFKICCSMYCFVLLFCVLFWVDNVLFYVLFVCKCVLLPPGVNPIAVKYIVSHHISKLICKK
jgi:hypothetical protein